MRNSLGCSQTAPAKGTRAAGSGGSGRRRLPRTGAGPPRRYGPRRPCRRSGCWDRTREIKPDAGPGTTEDAGLLYKGKTQRAVGKYLASSRGNVRRGCTLRALRFHRAVVTRRAGGSRVCHPDDPFTCVQGRLREEGSPPWQRSTTTGIPPRLARRDDTLNGLPLYKSAAGRVS